MAVEVGVDPERLVLVDDGVVRQSPRAEVDDARVGHVQVVDEHVDVRLLRSVPAGPGRWHVIGDLLEGQAAAPAVRVGDRGPARVAVVALEAEDRLPEPRGPLWIGALEDEAEQASDGSAHGAPSSE